VVSVYFSADAPGGRLGDLREYVATDVESFSLNRIIPVPVEIESDSDGMVGYNWRVDNWGTKWDVHEVEFRVASAGVEFYFDTAWAPPIPVIARLSTVFPDAIVGIAYDEPGMDFGGYVIFCDGVSVDGSEGASRSSTWSEQMEWSGGWES
jgi:hypothetical protein